MQVTIFGSAGQLGRELARASWPSRFTVRLHDRADVDICDPLAVAGALRGSELVINAAAYTAVDKAETDEAAAFRVNRDGPENLARLCRERGIALFHISTDYVFDGQKSEPYTEDDPTAPLGVYGQSKLAGERRVRELCELHVIVRTSWVVSAFGHNFVRTMLRLSRERDSLRVVSDQFGRPTPARDLSNVLLSLATRHAEGAPIPWGTYHFAGAGRASWHELASHVVELQAAVTGRRPAVAAISTSEYPTPARRPASSVLDTRKLEHALGMVPSPWQLGVGDIVRELLASSAATNQ